MVRVRRHLSIFIIPFFVWAFFFILLHPVMAENEEAIVIDFEEVTITGTGLERTEEENPVQTIVITGEEIAYSKAEDLDQVLEENGFEYTANAGGSGISLQGLSGNRILYLINGRPITGTPTGRLFSNEIPLSRIDRIEIIKGPQSALYGSDAMGGVINIITQKPGDRVEGSISIKNYSYPLVEETSTLPAAIFQKQILNGSFDWGGEILSNRISANIEKDWDFLNSDYKSLIPGLLQILGGYDGTVTISDSMLLDIGTSLLFDKEKDIIDDLNNSYEGQNTLRSSNYAELNFEDEIGGLWDIDACYNYYDQGSYTNLREARTEDSTFSEHYTSGELMYELLIDDWLLLSSGISGKADFASKSNIDEGAMKHRYTGALMMQTEFRGGLDSALLIGLRGEYNNDFGFNFTPRISGSFYPFENLKLLASCGFGYRAPTFLELYLDSAGRVYHKFGNPELKPETTLGTNIGIEYHGEFFKFVFDAYLNDLSNEIAYNYTGEYDESDLEVLLKENLEDTLRAGGGFNLTWNILENLAINGRYSYLFSYDQIEQAVLEDQPAHNAGGWVQYEAAELFSSRLTVSWLSEYARTTSKIYSSRLILDWSFKLDFEDYGNFSAGINNILDQKDSYNVYDAGRNIFIGYSIGFGA